MPTRITHFLHHSPVTGDQSVLTSFSTGVVHAHDLQAYLPDFQRLSRNYRGIVQGVTVKLTGSTSPTKVTIRVCADAAGDEVLVPDTEADLVAGVTTAGTKGATFRVDLPLWQDVGGPGNGTLYLFAKVDSATGTPKLAATDIFWQE